jgi:hypothetical protein
MNRSASWIAAWILAFAAGGCVSPPRWLHPGPAGDQQRKAERFDPYADNDASPAIAGARPRDFDKPLAEPNRARWTRRDAGLFGP